MILIVSSPEDLSTDFVIDWLKYYNHPYIRLNFTELIDPHVRKSIKYSLDNKTLKIEGNTIDVKSIKSAWFRKIGAFYKSDFYKEASAKGITKSLLDLLINEYKPFMMALLRNLNCNWLVNLDSLDQNKWWVLMKASEVGLTTPETFIINNKEDLEGFVHSNINKPLRDPIFISESEFYYTMYTKELNSSNIKQLPNFFLPSLIQKRIEKEFEIRSFFIDDEFYSMAIFSQSDDQTMVDFREYNWDKPNRNVPYKLPSDITAKLHKLSMNIGLNSGSVDLIKSKKGEYVFLEVNPHGQFGMVETPCNYELHHNVAKTLIKNDSYENRK